MLSKTKIKSRKKKKTNPELVETINEAAKNTGWMPLAKALSSSTSKHSKINLAKIDEESKAGDTIVIPGKVLSKGELTKKLKICSLSISERAKEKLKTTKSEFSTILEEIKSNSKAEGIKIIK